MNRFVYFGEKLRAPETVMPVNHSRDRMCACECKSVCAAQLPLPASVDMEHYLCYSLFLHVFGCKRYFDPYFVESKCLPCLTDTCTNALQSRISLSYRCICYLPLHGILDDLGCRFIV